MKLKSTGPFLVLAGCALGATASAQTVLSVPTGTPSIDAQGSAANSRITVSVASSYVLGNTISTNAFTLNSLAPGTFASDAYVHITCNAYPFLSAKSRLANGGAYTGSFQEPGGVKPLAGTLAGWNIPAGSDLTFEFYENFQDAPDGQVEQTIDGLLLSTNVASAPPAQIQNYTFTLPVPFAGTSGNSANYIVSFANSAPETILGNVIVLNGGSYSKLVPGEQLGEARGLITHFFNQAIVTTFSIFPGVNEETAIGEPIPVAPGAPRVTALDGPLTGALIPAAGRWVFRFWTNDADVAGGLPESQITGLEVGIVGTAAPPSRITFAAQGPLNAADDARQSTNGSITFGNTTTAFVLNPMVLVRSGTLTMVGVPSDGDDLIVRLRNSAWPFDYAEFRPTTEFFYNSPFTLIPFARQMVGSLVGKSMPAGSTFSIETYHDGGGEDTDRYDGDVEQVLDNFSFSLLNGPLVNNSALPAANDLGRVRIDNSPLLIDAGGFAPGQVKWYRFTIPPLANDNAYLDIFTSALAGGIEDTEIALYDGTGRLITQDDDDADLFLSALSFGKRNPPRTFLGDGNPLNGRDGLLAGGTYYLALAPFNATFGDRFAVSTTSGAYSIGTQLEIHTTLPPPVLTGTAELEDYTGSPSGEEIAILVTDGTISYQGTAILNGSGQYSLSLPLIIDPGTYSVLIKGDTFLRKRVDNVAISLTGGTSSTVSLSNGDVNNDNEVGPADFSILAVAFGSFEGDPDYRLNADLNVDGEVGPADFAILASNFGEFGQ